MRFRNSRLRTKVTALLVSLTALWIFAAWVTLREGVNLLFVTTYDSQLASPTDPLIAELQRERRLTVIRLADPATPRAELTRQRDRTDKVRADVVRKANSGSLRRSAGDILERRVNEMLARLKSLDAARQQIDAGSSSRPAAVGHYSETIESIFRTYDEISGLDDKQIAKDTRTLLQLNRMWELLSQEDALVVGALTTGRISPAEQLQFTQLAGARRLNTSRALTELQPSDQVLYNSLSKSARIAQVQRLEDQVMQARKTIPGSRTAIRPPMSAQQWSAATEGTLTEMRTTIQAAGDRLIERSTPVAIGVVLRLLLAGGLGLLAVIASIIVSITTARALVRQLEKLRGAAWELAEQRLPSVVERLGHGEKVDVETEAPPLRFGNDEIGEVGRAFNYVQETAIRTAVEQAELRRGIRDVLLSLARRTQTLVHRQLSMLDTMERRRDIDPKDLEELFRLDHLATRMRRNAENLIVLSGAIPARGWRRSVPMVDVVRAAVGEVEDYTRVQVLPFGPIELTGRAVGDVTHLLAELIENAVSFSPPDTVVQIGGHLVASGFAIDIEDRGLGLTDEKLADVNARIADPPEFNLQSSVQLGLFVVGKLAERYGLQVMLKRSAYGGTTAVVVIPRELVIEDPAAAARTPAAPAVTAPAEDGAESGAAQAGPRPVPAGATTENGLAVRQPTMVGASDPAAPQGRAGAGRQAAPSLVAVPNPPNPRDAAAGEDASRPGDPTTTGPVPGGSHTTGPAPAQPGPNAPGTGTPGPDVTGPNATGPLDTPATPATPTTPATASPPAPPAAPGADPAPVPGRVIDPNDAGAEGAARPETATPEDLPPVPDIDSTPSGLPVRVPQANLAPPLRTDEPLTEPEPEPEPDQGRSPEDILRIMGSYQRGTRRGRSEAARPGTDNAEGEDDQ
ncbi:nitrate- and nitrite sensing domain-containing protein [Spirillospora sp. NPDC029432]|uniref:sensor histidine kinase n=1 Tax=Spirillospora sp. NPDC029432 TaxID=3154599 RepID=UPI0034514137